MLGRDGANGLGGRHGPQACPRSHPHARQQDGAQRSARQDGRRAMAIQVEHGLAPVHHVLSQDRAGESRQPTDALRAELRGRMDGMRHWGAAVHLDQDVVVAHVSETRLDAGERQRRLPRAASPGHQHAASGLTHRPGMDEVASRLAQTPMEGRAQGRGALVGRNCACVPRGIDGCAGVGVEDRYRAVVLVVQGVDELAVPAADAIAAGLTAVVQLGHAPLDRRQRHTRGGGVPEQDGRRFGCGDAALEMRQRARHRLDQSRAGEPQPHARARRLPGRAGRILSLGRPRGSRL